MPESAAEVRRIAEAPGARDGGDGSRVLSCVAQVACRTREPLAHDPLCEAHLVVCPEPVQVPQRDVVRGGAALRCHGWIPEVLDDVFDDSLV